MSYQIIYPFVTVINGDTLKNAIKNYIKLSNDINITQLIIADNYKRYKASMKYYKHDIRNKVGINIYPLTRNAIIPPPVSIYSPVMRVMPIIN